MLSFSPHGLTRVHTFLFGLAGLALSACATPPPPAQNDADIARATIADLPTKTLSKDAPLQPLENTAPEQAAPPAPLVWEMTPDKQGLRHVPSGYICPSIIGGFTMTGEESFPGLKPGNDVSCVYEAPDGGAVKLHLTNFGRSVSTAAHLKSVQTIIRDTFQVQGTSPLPYIPDAPSRIEAFALKIGAISNLRPDVPVHTAVWIEDFAPWHVKVRATYEADRADAVGALVKALFAKARETIPAATRTLPSTVAPTGAPINN